MGGGDVGVDDGYPASARQFWRPHSGGVSRAVRIQRSGSGQGLHNAERPGDSALALR